MNFTPLYFNALRRSPVTPLACAAGGNRAKPKPQGQVASDQTSAVTQPRRDVPANAASESSRAAPLQPPANAACRPSDTGRSRFATAMAMNMQAAVVLVPFFIASAISDGKKWLFGERP